MASGFRHLLVLLGVGIDELLRRGLDRVPAIKPSGMDAAFKWGMECPDCIYVGSALQGGSTYRLWGNRGRRGTWGCRSCPGWGPPPTPSSTSSNWMPEGTSRSSSRRSPTRATGSPSTRAPPCSWSGTSSTTGNTRFR